MSGEGCAYIVDDGDGRCGAACRAGSPYCPEHHALCHLAGGSRAARRRLREEAALAALVGGRSGRPGRLPPERRRHDAIEPVERAFADAAGRPSRPYRVVDTLQIMERRGTITAGMRQAGEAFRARFACAQLDPLRALDLSRMRVGEAPPRREAEAPSARIEAARRAVWQAIQAVGGIASPAGSCLWHVLGWERSLKEWALEQGWSGRRVSQEAASGILAAALGALEAQTRYR